MLKIYLASFLITGVQCGGKNCFLQEKILFWQIHKSVRNLTHALSLMESTVEMGCIVSLLN